jgi:hypothetical protein
MSIPPEETAISARTIRIERRAVCARSGFWQRLGRRLAVSLEWLAYHSPYSVPSGEETYLPHDVLPRPPAERDG